jgi:hypothetical protein
VQLSGLLEADVDEACPDDEVEAFTSKARRREVV